MTFAVGILAVCTSCEEHKRLATQIADTNAEIHKLQTENSDLQNEISQLNQTNLSLRSHPAIRKGMGAFEQQLHSFEKDVATATERKNALEAEIAALRQDLESYRAKQR
jgi:predicted  nucleic acid-binding Zn-ribbon protein